MEAFKEKVMFIFDNKTLEYESKLLDNGQRFYTTEVSKYFYLKTDVGMFTTALIETGIETSIKDVYKKLLPALLTIHECLDIAKGIMFNHRREAMSQTTLFACIGSGRPDIMAMGCKLWDGDLLEDVVEEYFDCARHGELSKNEMLVMNMFEEQLITFLFEEYEDLRNAPHLSIDVPLSIDPCCRSKLLDHLTLIGSALKCPTVVSGGDEAVYTHSLDENICFSGGYCAFAKVLVEDLQAEKTELEVYKNLLPRLLISDDHRVVALGVKMMRDIGEDVMTTAGFMAAMGIDAGVVARQTACKITPEFPLRNIKRVYGEGKDISRTEMEPVEWEIMWRFDSYLATMINDRFVDLMAASKKRKRSVSPSSAASYVSSTGPCSSSY